MATDCARCDMSPYSGNACGDEGNESVFIRIVPLTFCARKGIGSPINEATQSLFEAPLGGIDGCVIDRSDAIDRKKSGARSFLGKMVCRG